MSELTINKICISCPFGCHLVIKISEKDESKYTITGNRCIKGIQYAESEITNPKRMVTTTVNLIGGELKRLPVKTAYPIPKHLILDLCIVLKKVSVNVPVKKGDVIVHDILSTGVDIIACRSILR